MDVASASRRRSEWRAGAWIVVLTLAVLLAEVPGATAMRTRAIDVSVGTERIGSPIGARFIGLSLETSTLPSVARDSTRGDLVGLLRSIAPGVIRFGGISAELSTTFSPGPYHDQPGSDRPARAPLATSALAPIDFLRPTTIRPADFDRLRALLRHASWTALLTVALGHYNPSAAAREAAAASRRLGRTLAGIEIGNEPNAYSVISLRPASWGYQQYLPQFHAYERAIGAAAPGVPIAGPDTVLGDGFGWLTAFAHDVRPAILTPHFYALSACSHPQPTLEDLLTPALATWQDQTLSALGMIGRAAHLKVRLGETNNIACEGQAGVSNTYGAALWAIRLMLSAARAGISGVNLHTLPESCDGRYSPICARTPADYAAGRFRAMPEWYALLVVRRLVGEQLLTESISGDDAGLTVEPLATPSGRRLDLVIVNTSSAPALSYSVRLRSPGRFRSSAVLWLTAPALDATSGVRFAGGSVGRDGSWQPARYLPTASRVGGEFRVTVPPDTAALVRLQTGPGTVSVN